MIHWLWANLWPNIFAPSVWTLVGLGASHFHHLKTLKRLEGKLDERH